MYDILFNNRSSNDLDLLVTGCTIPFPEKRVNAVSVEGRDGDLYENTGNYEDITITASFTFKSRNAEEWYRVFREVKTWLLSGSNEFVLTCDPAVFYKVKHVKLKTPERVLFYSGQFSVEFVCDPWAYYQTGKILIEADSINGAVVPAPCEPVYFIYGDGMFWMSVNNAMITADISQNLVIDTSLQLIYRKKDDGGEELISSTISGASIEALKLIKGENKLTFSEGFEVLIQPNWRC